MTLDEKREYCYLTVSLDDQIAVIRGAKLPFPFVRQIDAPFSEVCYAWSTIKRIVAKDRKFYT